MFTMFLGEFRAFIKQETAWKPAPAINTWRIPRNIDTAIIIAPTAEGYFDLNLDFTHADVSFKYEITLAADENSSVTDLVATGYSIDGSEKINFENYNDPITELIPLSSESKTRKIRVYIMWNDNADSQTMNNDADTLSTTSENPALFHVNISFTQITD